MKTYIIYGGNVPKSKDDRRRPMPLAVAEERGRKDPAHFQRVFQVDRITTIIELENTEYCRVVMGFHSSRFKDGCGLCFECGQARVWS